MFEKFLGRNLAHAEEKGTSQEQDEMSWFVNTVAQAEGELSDQLGGRKKTKDNPHHKPSWLVNAVISGIVNVLLVRKEIDSK